MPTVLCSTGCGTNLGNFNPTPYGSLSCQVCFTNGAYIRHLAATYSLVDKGVHDKILERLNA